LFKVQLTESRFVKNTAFLYFHRESGIHP